MSKPNTEPIILSVNSPEWLNFIETRPEATFFHHPAWINLLSECYHFESFIVVLRNEHGKIIGGIPFIEIPGIFGKKWVSLPFTDHCAPLYEGTNTLHKLSSTIISLNAIREIPRLELRWKYPLDPLAGMDPIYVLSQLKLNRNPEVVASRIRHKYFRKVNAAQERGVSTKMGVGINQLKEFYELHVRTRRKHGVPVQPWNYFKLLHEQVLTAGFGFLISAYLHQACVAAAVFLSWNKTLIYKYSTTNQEGRRSLATDLILWNAICWGCENGLQVLDMGRTDISDIGLLDFKKRWGSETTSLPYSFIPDQETRKKADPMVSLMKLVIRHSPIWVCRLSGELFYRFSA
ncbi:MAG: GNAT family N-acetyltransferase [Anaerolineaceae bacterium]|nr:GNAT family N-acetyltransferase [Anaerolineaceae bacterium]